MHSNNAQPIDGAEIYEEVSLGEGEPICTGDLFSQIEALSKPDGAGVVLTPQCDLHQGKIEWVKFAYAIPFRSYLEETLIAELLKDHKDYGEEIKNNPKTFGSRYLNVKQNRDDHKTKSLLKGLIEIIKNVKPRQLSHYYLPRKDDQADDFLVDFSRIFPVRYNELRMKQPLLRLKSPWREQLLNRYVGYSKNDSDTFVK